MRVWSLGRKDPLEEEVAIHSSIPAWRIPWTEEPGRLQFMGLQKVRHSCSTEHRDSTRCRFKTQHNNLNYVHCKMRMTWLWFLQCPRLLGHCCTARAWSTGCAQEVSDVWTISRTWRYSLRFHPSLCHTVNHQIKQGPLAEFEFQIKEESSVG